MGWGILYRMVVDVMASVLRLPRVGQNVCVDAIVREWLYQTLGEEAAHNRLGD